MSSAVRIVAARSGVRLGSAAVKTTGVAGLTFASRAGASSHAGVAASCRVPQLAFTRGFMSTVGDNAAASAEATVTKKATPKKAAAKKAAPAKKVAAKKPVKAAAKKVTAKAKKPVKKVAKGKKKVKKVKAKKAKPKKVKKELTEEQLKRREARALATKIRTLKAEALFKDGPATLPSRSWILYCTEAKNDSTLAPVSAETLKTRMTELSRRFKALSAGELEALRAKAAENLKKNEEAYKAWVESHSPETIATANRARQHLVRLAKEGKTSALPLAKKRKIEDHRLPKRGMPAYAIFTQERWASGEFGSDKLVSEVTQVLKEEWKLLSDSERAKYVDLSNADRAEKNQDLSAALEKLSL